MTMIEIIPAIDIIGGECVRLSQGDYDKKTTYFKDPSEVAVRFRDAGIRRLHLVDLEGAKASEPKNLAVLEKVASRTGMDIQYGGGIKSAQALQAVFDSGANRAICGSIAITNSEAFRGWLDDFGPSKIILGADVKNGFVATHGWLESSEVTAQTLISQFEVDGLSQVICTDISKDGMLQGPTFDLYQQLQAQFPAIDITVSGGISSIEDIVKLNEMALRSVIVGKAFYEGRITLKQLEECSQKE